MKTACLWLIALLALPLPTVAADRGRILFLRHCAECHGAEGRGDGPTASILTKTPANLRDPELWKAVSDKDVERFVLKGRRLRLELRPKALSHHAEQTEAIYSFVRQLPSRDWQAIEAGEAIYLDRCLPCHDSYGHPQAKRPPGVAKPRDLSDPALQASTSDEDLASRVRHGKAGMPAVVPRISESEAERLLPYVRILSPGYEFYDRFCLSCHGPYGEGSAGVMKDVLDPDFAFDEIYFRKRTPDEIRSSIWHMLRDKNQWMPHFAGIITREDVDQIIAWLRSLPPGR